MRDTQREDPHDRMHQLTHDVAKYVTRIARNLPNDGPIPEVLGAMLVKDLYETHRGRPASVCFDDLSQAIIDVDVRTQLRAHLTEIDALEARVRNGDAEAMRRAAALALTFERALRDFVDASEGT
jgi:hypothetical protein